MLAPSCGTTGGRLNTLELFEQMEALTWAIPVATFEQLALQF